MSKAAVFAGLGQGLMALGQGAGRALETISIEKLRQQNFEQNWAREDKIRQQDMQMRQSERQEDMQLRQVERTEDNSFKQQQLDATNTNNEGLMDLRRNEQSLTQEQIAYERDNKGFSEKRITREDGENVMQSTNKAGDVVREQIIPASLEKLPEATKMQYKQAADELNVLIEFNDGDTPRAVELRNKMDALLGVESSGPISLVQGLTVEQVIAKYKEANPSISDAMVLQMARQQGHIQ